MVDTDVIAAALLSEPSRGEEASRLLARTSDLMAPGHWKAELAYVIWKAVKLGRLPDGMLGPVIEVAARLPVRSVDVSDLWLGAVTRAVAADHPVYDTLFVELAVREGTHVASYDAEFRKRFPEHVVSPRSLLD